MSTIKIEHSLVPESCFLTQIPKAPLGRYAHIVMIRETESFPLFQTDGTLNIARVRSGLDTQSRLIRITMLKRKQSSPERLVGRELLRLAGITQNEDKDGENYCDYNENFCQSCPDCVYYGFAIGDSGSEKSKVYVDSAYSITGYDISHQQFTFNALFEKGNMSQQGENRSSIGEQDHVIPQVFFPAVVTIKDVTLNSFSYVLNNVLRTKRYGAQTTRTGRVANNIVGVVFADGEIFSNLKLTQAIYDDLGLDKSADQTENPLGAQQVIESAKGMLENLLEADGVSFQLIGNNNLSQLLETVTTVTTNPNKLESFLQEANAETSEYAERVILKANNKKKK